MLERLEATRARLVRRVAMALGRCDMASKLLDVECDSGACQGDRLPSDLEPAPAECRLERREGAAQCRTGAIGIGLGPEQTRERVSAGRSAGERKVCEESGRLARVDVERAAVDLDQWRPDKRDMQL